MLKNFVFFLLLATSFFCGIVPNLMKMGPSENGNKTVQAQKVELESIGTPPKVNLTVLTESFCPFCGELIVKRLPDVYNKLKQYIQLEIVPYGNAFIFGGIILCQHGPKECEINKYQSCVINYVKEPLGYIVCMEKVIIYTKNQTAIDLKTVKAKCHDKIAAEIVPKIDKCYEGTEGHDLQLKAANRTKHIGPEKKYGVPWILVNNQSRNEYQTKDLFTLLCDHLKGVPECVEYEAKKRENAVEA